MGLAARKFDALSFPDPEERKPRRNVDTRGPLWEEPEPPPQEEHWLDVEALLDAKANHGEVPAELLAADESTGDAVVGFQTEDGRPRLRLITSEAVRAENEAQRRLDQLAKYFDTMVDAFLKLGKSEEDDFDRDEILAMKDIMISEALRTDDPQAELLAQLKDIAGFEKRARQQAYLHLEKERHGLLAQLDRCKDADTRTKLTTQLEGLKRRIFQTRRELDPKASRSELADMAADLGEFLEPVNWRPHKEQSVDEIRARVDALRSEMEAVDKEGKFNPVSELKWFALRDELKEYELMLRGAEFKARRPHLFKTDFVPGKERLPWDQQLQQIGEELDRAKWTVRDSGTYRMLRGAYLDSGQQLKAIHIADAVLRSKSSSEQMREAAKALKEDVKAGRLPQPEMLRQRVVEKQRERRLAATRRLWEREQQKKPEPEKAAVEQAQIEQVAVMSYDKTRTQAKVVEDIADELGMQPMDIVKLHKAFRAIDRRFKNSSGLQHLGMSFNWIDFINAPPNGETKKSRPKQVWNRFAQKIGMSPRKRMLRQMRRAAKRLPSSSQRVLKMELGKNNILGI